VGSGDATGAAPGSGFLGSEIAAGSASIIRWRAMRVAKSSREGGVVTGVDDIM